jgi:acid phosphatase
MENKNSSEVIGQSDQPYTNSLANTYGLATQSYAFGHPSLPNYLDIVSGSNQGVTDDNPPSSHSFPGAQTLADQLAAAGISEKAYAENLPADPTNDSGEYAVRHVPWEYFPNAKITVANASSLTSDLNGSSPPAFVWYTPNLIDDEHDGTVQQGDAFLSSFIPSVQATSWYKSGGQIIVEWDESDTDNTGINGGDGGRVSTIVVSDALKANPRQSTENVDTAGVLHSIEDAYGLPHLGGSSGDGTIDALLNGS